MIDTKKELLKVLIDQVQKKATPFDQQKTIWQGKYPWCRDWYIIEVLKCLYWTPPAYRLDPLPCRLKNNPMFPGREYIIIKAEEILPKFQEGADIIRLLEDGFNST